MSRFPGLKAGLPFLKLTDLPTPVSRAESLAGELGIDSLAIKRDDVSAQIYGGNKVRKLELLLADALRRQCDAVLTYGAVGSNHALATSIYARQAGLDCYAILTDQPRTPSIPATLRYHALLGTRLVHARRYSEVEAATADVFARHATGPERVYAITWGGSSWLGTTGFVSAALELADQLPGALAPDTIYVAGGTMGTALGLAIGLRLAGLPTRIQLVQVTPPAVFSKKRFEHLFHEVIGELHARDPAVPVLRNPLENIRVRGEFLGKGYADPTPAAVAAVELAKDTEGLKLETTYSGKAMAALVQDARTGELGGRNVLFWATYNSRPYPDEIAGVSTRGLPDSLVDYLA